MVAPHTSAEVTRAGVPRAPVSPWVGSALGAEVVHELRAVERDVELTLSLGAGKHGQQRLERYWHGQYVVYLMNASYWYEGASFSRFYSGCNV